MSRCIPLLLHTLRTFFFFHHPSQPNLIVNQLDWCFSYSFFLFSLLFIVHIFPLFSILRIYEARDDSFYLVSLLCKTISINNLICNSSCWLVTRTDSEKTEFKSATYEFQIASDLSSTYWNFLSSSWNFTNDGATCLTVTYKC